MGQISEWYITYWFSRILCQGHERSTEESTNLTRCSYINIDRVSFSIVHVAYLRIRNWITQYAFYSLVLSLLDSFVSIGFTPIRTNVLYQDRDYILQIYHQPKQESKETQVSHLNLRQSRTEWMTKNKT